MDRLAWLEGRLSLMHMLKCREGRPGLSGTSFYAPNHPPILIIAIT